MMTRGIFLPAFFLGLVLCTSHLSLAQDDGDGDEVHERLDRLEKALQESREKNRALEEKVRKLEEKQNLPPPIEGREPPKAGEGTPPKAGLGAVERYFGSDLPPPKATEQTRGA